MVSKQDFAKENEYFIGVVDTHDNQTQKVHSRNTA